MTKYTYDICAMDEFFQRRLEETPGVKMTGEHNKYYTNNYFGNYKARCESKICTTWEKNEERKIKKKN